MADRQVFAKLGIVVLLGLNAGAYYLFWPKNNGIPVDRAEAPTRISPVAPLPEPPRNFPVTQVTPLSIPDVPVKTEKMSDTEDAVNRLLDRIQKDNSQPIPVEGKPEAPQAKMSDPPLVMPSPNPRDLPPLKAEPISDGGNDDPNVGITSALTRKSPQSAWVVNVTKPGSQTRVSAKLRHASAAKPAAEFEIVCDRIDLNGPDGQLALGNVTFVGAGIKGACQRLTMSWNSPSLLFEGQVRITAENVRGWSLPSSQLSGEPHRLGATGQ